MSKNTAAKTGKGKSKQERDDDEVQAYPEGARFFKVKATAAQGFRNVPRAQRFFPTGAIVDLVVYPQPDDPEPPHSTPGVPWLVGTNSFALIEADHRLAVIPAGDVVAAADLEELREALEKATKKIAGLEERIEIVDAERAEALERATKAEEAANAYETRIAHLEKLIAASAPAEKAPEPAEKKAE